MKNKERLRNCSKLKEIKEAWRLNAICDPELDLGLGGKSYRILVESLAKLECGTVD